MNDSKYRFRDFYMMEVKSIDGKILGFIKGIDINFSESRVKGFIISSYSFTQRSVKVLVEDIISFNEVMIVSCVTRGESLDFNSIRKMDVVDTKSNILGMIEELIFDGNSFIIEGIIVSTGLIKDLIIGKRIFSTEYLILGEKSVLCNDKGKKLSFLSVSHKIAMEDCNDEKMV